MRGVGAQGTTGVSGKPCSHSRAGGEDSRDDMLRIKKKQKDTEQLNGACALAIKAHALHREGRRLESRRELWVYKNRVAREFGEWVRHAFMVADSMHKN